jgi:hypothetical protein
MSGQTTWIVTGSGERSLREIATDLRQHGLQVDSVLDAVGSITGRGAADLGARLRSVKGVAAVEKDTPVDIGPPDAPVS